MSLVKEGRDRKIDILRFIAMLCIILAHSEPNRVVFQIRNFDVTLMVLLLGVSFYLSNNSKEIKYIPYLRKRFLRLVIPTWVFLIIFFSLFLLISSFLGNEYFFNIKDIITSFTLISGIGYVWIMKVFLIVASVSPFILSISKKIESNQKYFLLLVIAYALYSVLLIFYQYLNDSVQKLFELLILEGIGYSIIAALGIRLISLNKKEIFSYCVFFLMIFLILMFWYDFSSTQQYKYPPTIYYFSYGIFISLLLYILLDIPFFFKIFNNKFVFFVSEKSLWLYFWHIIPIHLLKFYGATTNMQLLNSNFMSRYIFIFTVALMLTLIQEKISFKLKLILSGLKSKNAIPNQ